MHSSSFGRLALALGLVSSSLLAPGCASSGGSARGDGGSEGGADASGSSGDADIVDVVDDSAQPLDAQNSDDAGDVGKTSFSLALATNVLSLTPGESRTIEVYVGDSSGTVVLSVRGAPPGVTAVFDALTGAGALKTAMLKLTASPSAAAGLSELTVAAKPGGSSEATASLLVTVRSEAVPSTGYSAVFGGANARHMCALRTDGSAQCWGSNRTEFYGSGCIGDGTFSHAFRPVTVLAPGGPYKALSLGQEHTCGVTTGDRAYCWGQNLAGEVGDGTEMKARPTPTAVSGGISFAAVPIGQGAVSSCALTSTGLAHCWGRNTRGQLGDGSTTPKLTPAAVSGGLVFRALSVGYESACGLTAAGAAWCWGRDFDGILGNGLNPQDDAVAPRAVSGGHTWAELSVGTNHACGITTGNRAYCWGAPDLIGDPKVSTAVYVPVAVVTTEAFFTIRVARDHTCALTPAGRAFCWGGNIDGQLGDGTTTERLAPVPVLGGLTFTSLATASANTCGTTSAGEVYCWGRAAQVGDGTTFAAGNIQRTTPVKILPSLGPAGDSGPAGDATIADTGVAMDTATPTMDAPPGDTGAVCNDLAQNGGEVFRARVASPYPSFTGGTITAGTWVLTKMTEYTGAGGMTGTDTTPQRWTILVAGMTSNNVRQAGTSAASRFTSSFTTTGSKVTFTDSCPTVGTRGTFDYSATATTWEQGLYFSGGQISVVFTYTKQ